MTTYPTTKDTFVNPTSTDKVSEVSHADQHTLANDALGAVQTKVGINGDTNQASHDYKLSEVTGANKASSIDYVDTEVSTAQTTVQGNLDTHVGNVANPHSVTKTQVDLGNVDNTSDTTKNTATATLTNKTITDSTNTVTANGLRTATGTVSVSGATAPITGQVLTATNGTTATWQEGSVAPLPLTRRITTGTHSYSDSNTVVVYSTGTPLHYLSELDPNGLGVNFDFTSVWADANDLSGGFVSYGNYMYVLAKNTTPATNAYRLYRFDMTNADPASTAEQLSFAGAQVLTDTNSDMKMSFDGTHFYFTFEAGNSANQYKIAKYSVSGTTLTYVSTITLDTTTVFQRYCVKVNGNIVTVMTTGWNIFNSSGTLIKGTGATNVMSNTSVTNYSDKIYSATTSSSPQAMFLTQV